jgi:hypothetical protein
MELRKFIATTIREYLNEQVKKQSKNSHLNSDLWNLVNSEYFMQWSNNWSDVLLDKNNEPAIFYRGISLWKDEKIDWNFNKSFFTMDKSYAQNFAQNIDDGSFNDNLIFSFFLKSKFTINVEEYLKGIGIDSKRIKTKYKDYQHNFRDYKKFLSDFNKSDIIIGDEDGSGNFSYYVKDDKNVLPINKLSEIVKKKYNKKT